MSTKISSLILILVLVVSIISFGNPFAFAEKASGSFLPKTRHKNVCGDQLCNVAGAKQRLHDVMENLAKEGGISKINQGSHMMMTSAEWKTKSGTITSVQDPGIGHESHQLAIILAPGSNIFKGILTYDASENIQLVALHGPLGPDEDKGQAIWTPDGTTKFALTFIDPKNSSGSWLFSGNALAVHTKNPTPFTVSYSVSYTENQPTETTKTETLTSVQDPGMGHESHQLAIILPLSPNTYTGLLTYSSSENIQLVALHGPLSSDQVKGQKTWTQDGKTIYALTFVDPDNSMGAWAFSGNALAVHTKNTTPFTVSYSVVADK